MKAQMKMNIKTNTNLLLTFLKIGAFTFGGGYAMLPLIKREITESKKWLTLDEMIDIIVIAESTPGPLAVNCATFVGNKISGTLGAFLATLGVVSPSFVIILLVSFVLEQIEHLPIIKYAFEGIRAGVLVLIISALISVFKQLSRNIFSYSLILFAFICICFLHISAIVVLITCTMVSLIWTFIIRHKKENTHKTEKNK